MAIEVNSPPRLAYEPIRRPASRERSGDDLDWFGLLRTLWRRKFFLVGFVATVLVLTAAWVSSLPPQYEAESLVMFNERQTRVVDIPDVLTGLPPQEERLQGQLLLVKSRGMAEQMMDRLQLHLLPEFNPALRPESAGLAALLDPVKPIPGTLLDRLPRAWADTLMTSTSPVEMTDQQQAALLRTEIIEGVLESISAEPVGGSTTVMRLSFVSTDPELARLGANALAQLYLDQQLEAKQAASNQASEFLQEEIQRLRVSVDAAEQAIQQYRRNKGLLEGPEPIDAQQLSQLNTQLVLAQSERAQAEARLRQVQRLIDSDLEAAAQMLDSALLAQFRAREAEINRELAELSQEFGDRHPRMVAARAELASLQNRMQSEIRQISGRLRDEAQVLRSREAALQSNIERLQGQLAVRGESEIGLEALERDLNADRELLETYLNRVKEIESQQKAQQADARIIATAVVPDEPAYPKRLLIFGIAFFGAALFGSMAVFGLESLDHTFRSSEQIEDQLGLATLGLVPLITNLDRRDGRPEDYVIDNPNSPFGEALRSLRTAILLTSGGTPPNTLLLTSSVPGEGKTSIAMCLARVNARAGLKTLVIDCDLRRPRLHELTGIENHTGLSDLLLRQRELDDVLLADDRTGAVFITAGPPVPDPAALMSSERMRRLLKQVAASYDLVILDSPPVLSVSDSRVLSQLVDKTVFLVHWGSSRRNDVMMGVKQLIEAGADMGGIVLSQVNARKHAKYGYRDSGYYYDDKYTKYYHKA